MIVKLLWATKKRNYFDNKTYVRFWKGFFLFGFIPLYIDNFNNEVLY